MPKLLENHDITIFQEPFFQIFDLGNIFENLDQKVPKNDQKCDFWQKITFKDKIFKKYCLN